MVGQELQALPPARSIELSRAANDRMAAACAAHPDRFEAFATLPMSDPVAAADELRRGVGELGFLGAMVHGQTGGRWLDDPADERLGPVTRGERGVAETVLEQGLGPTPPPCWGSAPPDRTPATGRPVRPVRALPACGRRVRGLPILGYREDIPTSRRHSRGPAMSYDNITYEREGHLALVTINRPEVFNAINPETSAEMLDAFSSFRDDDDAWAAILTGAGERAFSAGNDLKATAARNAEGSAARSPGERVAFGGITKGFDCPKPLIAAVNGYAMGGGFELALACDIIIASENARFALPEPRVGLVAGAGGLHWLPRHIPRKIAMGLLLTGSQVDAAEAWRIGLVNEVVPLPKLLETARAWTDRIFECSPISVRVTKECALAGMTLSVDDAIDDDIASGRMAKLFNSDDVKEGPKAFAEKRKPQWTGH